MQFDPPRAQKKYSQTLEFHTGRLHRLALDLVPEWLKPDGVQIPFQGLLAAAFSVVPGLGHFYLTQNIRWSLAQFGICLALFLSYFFTFGTSLGTPGCVLLLGLHQYFMYRAYLKALQINQIPFPVFWKATAISLGMTVALSILYAVALYGPLTGHLFYAGQDFGDAIVQEDRIWVSQEPQYKAGDIVTFNRDFHYRHGAAGTASLVERVLAVPGDHVSGVNGAVLVNGLPLSPKIRPLEKDLNFQGDLTVPEGSYFILYGITTNERYNVNWFLLHQEDILGKLAYRYFPLPGVLS